MNATPRTAAEINARLGAVGLELAKGRMAPVKNAKELEAEQDRLAVAYCSALIRESEAARDDAEVKARVESARQEIAAREREARIKRAVAEATAMK
jgi:hypothetical protein